jgi:hypothetical protein
MSLTTPYVETYNVYTLKQRPHKQTTFNFQVHNSLFG